MAGNVGDVVRVALKGTFNGTVIRNVWFYTLMDAPTAGYLTGLLTDFQTTVMTPYAAACTTAIVFDSLIATNIFSGDEVVDVTVTPAAGTRAVSGDQLVQFIAAMVVLERQNGRVRNGRKFLPVSLENDIAISTFAAGFITLGNAVATACAANINAGGVDLFTPTIVGRIAYTASSGKPAYRLPVSQGEMGDKFSLVSSARFINRVTTMNSRKPWRGE